jgi:hypothetical protein
LDQWRETQLALALTQLAESKMAPENVKEILATCQARLSEDLARGSLVECDRMRSASSRAMSARAEARAGGAPSVPVLKTQPLGYQVKSLHESSLKMKVQSSVEFMNQKIRFSARSVHPTGSRESLRTLCGFYFPSDGSMTIYEFKQLKRTNVAQHFIERNVHWHVKGPRKGNSYLVSDISVGENLTFFPGDHPTLPEALGKDPSLTLRITAVDMEAKKKALTAMKDGVTPTDEELVLPVVSEDEAQQRLFLSQVQVVSARVRTRRTSGCTKICESQSNKAKYASDFPVSIIVLSSSSFSSSESFRFAQACPILLKFTQICPNFPVCPELPGL